MKRVYCNRRQIALVAFLGCVLGANVCAKADILVSNLTEPFRENTPITNTEYWAAQAFGTALSPFSVSSIAIIGGNAANSPAVVAELRRADGAGEIDLSAAGLISTFTAPDLTGAESTRTFLPNSSINLDSSTVYWFLLGSSNTGSYDWSYANTNFFSGPGYLHNFADSADGGATWIYHSTADFPYYLQVNGTSAIPEPTNLLFAAGLALGFVGRIRRRQK